MKDSLGLDRAKTYHICLTEKHVEGIIPVAIGLGHGERKRARWLPDATLPSSLRDSLICDNSDDSSDDEKEGFGEDSDNFSDDDDEGFDGTDLNDPIGDDVIIDFGSQIINEEEEDYDDWFEDSSEIDDSNTDQELVNIKFPITAVGDELQRWKSL